MRKILFYFLISLSLLLKSAHAVTACSSLLSVHPNLKFYKERAQIAKELREGFDPVLTELTEILHQKSLKAISDILSSDRVKNNFKVFIYQEKEDQDPSLEFVFSEEQSLPYALQNKRRIQMINPMSPFPIDASGHSFPIAKNYVTLSKAILLSLDVLHSVIMDNYQELENKLDNKTRQKMNLHTFWGEVYGSQYGDKINNVENIHERVLIKILMEGFLTVAQTSFFLAPALSPDSPESFIQAMKRVSYSGKKVSLISLLGLLFTFSEIGNHSAAGYYLGEGGIEFGKDQSLELNFKLKEELMKRKKVSIEEENRSAELHLKGTGCPFGVCLPGRGKSGIDLYTELFFNVFDIVYKEILIKNFK